MDEDLIIDQIKKGNRKELADVYRTYRSEFITWITSQYDCSKDEAREVYQVSILILYDNIVNEKLVRLNSSIKTYLFAIAKNKFLEHKKRESKYIPEINTTDYSINELVVIEKQEKERNLNAMEKSLEILGDPCKTLLQLYYFKNKSMDEISQIMDYKNRDTAKNLKCKCMARLREIFRSEKSKHST